MVYWVLQPTDSLPLPAHAQGFLQRENETLPFLSDISVHRALAPHWGLASQRGRAAVLPVNFSSNASGVTAGLFLLVINIFTDFIFSGQM